MAAPRRSVVVERSAHRPLGRILDLAVRGDVDRASAGDLSDVGQIFAVKVAQRSGKAEPVARSGEILRKARVGFDLDAAHAGLAGIGRGAAEVRQSVNGAGLRSWDLHILIFSIENCRCQLQSVIEERGLPPQLVAVDRLRLEGEEVENVLIRLGFSIDALAARIESTAFEATRIADVEIVVGIRLEVDRGARRERLVCSGAGEIGGCRAKDGTDAKTVRAA